MVLVAGATSVAWVVSVVVGVAWTSFFTLTHPVKADKILAARIRDRLDVNVIYFIVKKNIICKGRALGD